MPPKTTPGRVTRGTGERDARALNRNLTREALAERTQRVEAAIQKRQQKRTAKKKIQEEEEEEEVKKTPKKTPSKSKTPQRSPSKSKTPQRRSPSAPRLSNLDDLRTEVNDLKLELDDLKTTRATPPRQLRPRRIPEDQPWALGDDDDDERTETEDEDKTAETKHQHLKTNKEIQRELRNDEQLAVSIPKIVEELEKLGKRFETATDPVLRKKISLQQQALKKMAERMEFAIRGNAEAYDIPIFKDDKLITPEEFRQMQNEKFRERERRLRERIRRRMARLPNDNPIIINLEVFRKLLLMLVESSRYDENFPNIRLSKASVRQLNHMFYEWVKVVMEGLKVASQKGAKNAEIKTTCRTSTLSLEAIKWAVKLASPKLMRKHENLESSPDYDELSRVIVKKRLKMLMTDYISRIRKDALAYMIQALFVYITNTLKVWIKITAKKKLKTFMACDILSAETPTMMFNEDGVEIKTSHTPSMKERKKKEHGNKGKKEQAEEANQSENDMPYRDENEGGTEVSENEAAESQMSQGEEEKEEEEDEEESENEKEREQEREQELEEVREEIEEEETRKAREERQQASEKKEKEEEEEEEEEQNNTDVSENESVEKKMMEEMQEKENEKGDQESSPTMEGSADSYFIDDDENEGEGEDDPWDVNSDSYDDGEDENSNEDDAEDEDNDL